MKTREQLRNMIRKNPEKSTEIIVDTLAELILEVYRTREVLSSVKSEIRAARRERNQIDRDIREINVDIQRMS